MTSLASVRGHTKPSGFVTVYMATEGKIGYAAERLIDEIRGSPDRYSLSSYGFLDDEGPRDCKAKRQIDSSGKWVQCNSIKRETKEKAVDVALALDLALGASPIGYRTAYDTAFLVSIDRDFLPAVIRARQTGATVYNAFPKAGKLASMCDGFVSIDITKIIK